MNATERTELDHLVDGIADEAPDDDRPVAEKPKAKKTAGKVKPKKKEREGRALSAQKSHKARAVAPKKGARRSAPTKVRAKTKTPVAPVKTEAELAAERKLRSIVNLNQQLGSDAAENFMLGRGVYGFGSRTAHHGPIEPVAPYDLTREEYADAGELHQLMTKAEALADRMEERARKAVRP